MKIKHFFLKSLALLFLLASCTAEENDGNKGNVTINGHVGIDLGLPSGTRWASTNIGAQSPEGRGDFFQWAETVTCTDKSENIQWNSSYTPGMASATDSHQCGTDKDPVCQDGIILQGTSGSWSGSIAGNARYDAATSRWGGSWMMPTEEQIRELFDHCVWKQTTINGIEGYEVKGRTGKTIFLPLGGYRKYLNLDRGGSAGCLWSATIDSSLPSRAMYLIYELNDKTGKGRMAKEERCIGFNIRPVTKEKPMQ